jgi:photosystem II stability/assembly factor-like uncharacterized protein
MKILILLQFLIALNIRADWQKINSFPSNPVQDIHFSGNIIYAATGSNGVYKSTDGMLSWAEINNGLSNTQALLCKQIISSGGILYVATADGIYKSINSGTNWVRKSAGIVVAGMSYAYCESIFEFNGSLFTGSYTGIYRSTNGGENWLETNVSGTHIWAKKFTLHGGILFAARDVGNSPNGYKSTDNGLTWDDLSTLTVPSITFFSEPGKLFAGTVHGAWLLI